MSIKKFPVLTSSTANIVWVTSEEFFGVTDIARWWVNQQPKVPAPKLADCLAALVKLNVLRSGDYTALMNHCRKEASFPEFLPRKNTEWDPAIAYAKEWVEEQALTLGTVTLRQVFYHLVAEGYIVNSVGQYQRLSALTSTARWADEFPDLADESNSIYVLRSWDSISSFAYTAADYFGLDVTEGQKFQVVIGIEKKGMRNQMDKPFGARGWKIVPLGGYGSTTVLKQLKAEILDDARPAVLIYAGDFDASGLDIYNDFIEKVPFDVEIRAALNEEQIAEFGLKVWPGKVNSEGNPSDPRSKKFMAQWSKDHSNIQVEVDALKPADLVRLMSEAAAPYWDEVAWQAVQSRIAGKQELIREALLNADDE